MRSGLLPLTLRFLLLQSERSASTVMCSYLTASPSALCHKHTRARHVRGILMGNGAGELLQWA